jgi:hypothetical protein
MLWNVDLDLEMLVKNTTYILLGGQKGSLVFYKKKVFSKKRKKRENTKKRKETKSKF